MSLVVLFCKLINCLILGSSNRRAFYTTASWTFVLEQTADVAHSDGYSVVESYFRLR